MILTKVTSSSVGPWSSWRGANSQQHKQAPSPSSVQADEVVLLFPLAPCLTKTREVSRRDDEFTAQMDQDGGINKHPTLCPFGEQQPGDHEHRRDHPGTDCFPVRLVPKATKKEAGSSAPGRPGHLFISLFVLMLGRLSLVPFRHLGGARG